MKSVMQHNFATVPKANIGRSSFDRSHGLKTAFNPGLLIPILADEILPGDSVSLKLTAFARLSSTLTPVMDNAFLETFFFFTPNRLVFDNWGKFLGAQEDPGDSTDFLIPQLVSSPVGGWLEDTIYDYMGLPTQVEGVDANALHFRAHNLIYNTWFRDENLIDSVDVPTGAGPDALNKYDIYKRGKRNDYFTAGLPWPQKSEDGAVSIPLGTSAPVTGLVTRGGSNQPTFRDANATPNEYTLILATIDGQQSLITDPVSGAPDNADTLEWLDPKLELSSAVADLSSATSATINELRQAFQLQKLYERDARGGTREQEVILAHFNVLGSDARLNRPEYLGGGHTQIQFNTTPNTAQSATGNLGDLGGYGTGLIPPHGFTKSFTEFGTLLAYACVRADLTYQQGIHRMWSRQTRFDFYWPALQSIGEQTVLNKEIYAQGTVGSPSPGDDDVFSYIPRHDEYRFKQSQLTGAMRSNHSLSLDVWHLSQDFAALPVLNQTFIEEDPPVDRVVAVTSAVTPNFLFDGYFSIRHVRPMPLFGVPGMIDRF